MAITYSQHADLTLEDIHALTRWEVVSTAARLALVLVEADNDKICHQTDNHSYWILADYTGPTWVEITSAGVAAVTSVFGEIGDVSEADANFTAADIVNVPAGTVAATDVQAAIDELEAEKAPATHTHVLSQVTDAGTAAAEDVGVALGDIPQLEDIGGGTPGLPAVDGSQLTGVAGGGSAITVTDEGGAPLTTDVVSFDFVGTGVTASSVGDDVTVTIAAGAAPIDTVFGRTGTVVATPSDYDASQVDNDSTVTGAFVDDALNTLDADKAATADSRFPTTDEKGALAGTGTPSGSNRYVVDDDSRLTNNVSAGATVTDHALVRGDGGSRGVQGSGISIDDTDNVTGVTTFEVGGVTLDGAGLNETSAGYFFGGADGGASPADNVFTGGTSNSASVKGGANYTRGGIASGATSEGGDLNLYGGTGTSGPGAVRVGGYDTTASASEIEMMKGFSIREASDHPNATVAGRGQLWPRSSDGAIMWTDRDDVDHDLTTSGSGTMAIEDEGTPVSGGPHSTMDFIGAGVTAADAGGGTVSITIAPGAAPIDTVFGRTGTVVAVTGDYTASEVTNVPAGTIAATNVQTAINELDSEKAAAAHTQGYTTINGVPTDTFLGRDTGGTGAAEAMAVATAQSLLNVEDGSVAAGTSGDAYAASHEIDATAHDGDSIVNTPAGTIAATNVQGAINELDTFKAAASHGHTLSDISDSGTAAAEDTGVLIGDLPLLENVGGNPGLPAVDGSQLTGIDTGTPITVIDESTELTTNLNQLTFAGSNVVATEPGAEGEILVTISGAAGAIDVSDGTTTVSGADLLTFDGTAFDVTDQGSADALVDPIFNTTAGTFAEGDHTHDTLANVATNVILGRATAGSGPSEELTPSAAAALLDHANIGTGIGTNTHAQIDTHVDGDGSDHADVATNSAHVADVTTNPHETSLENLEPGTHVHLEQASVDSGKIFASLQTSQVASLTAEASPVAADLFPMEQATGGAWRGVERQDIIGADEQTLELTTDLHVKALGVDTAQLADEAVTVGKMAQMAATTLMGNSTGSPATPTALDVATFSGMVDHDQTTNHVADEHTLITQSGSAPGGTPATGDWWLNTTTGELLRYGGASWSDPVGLPIDDLSLEVVSNKVQLDGVDAATTGHVPSKAAGGGLTWAAASGGGFDYAAPNVFVGAWETSAIAADDQIGTVQAVTMDNVTQINISLTWDSVDHTNFLTGMAGNVGSYLTIYDSDGTNYWSYRCEGTYASTDADSINTIDVIYEGGSTTTAPSDTDVVRFKLTTAPAPVDHIVLPPAFLTFDAWDTAHTNSNWFTHTVRGGLSGTGPVPGWASGALDRDMGTSDTFYTSLTTDWLGWVVPADCTILSMDLSIICVAGGVGNINYRAIHQERTSGSSSVTNNSEGFNIFLAGSAGTVVEQQIAQNIVATKHDAVGYALKRYAAATSDTLDITLTMKIVY